MESFCCSEAWQSSTRSSGEDAAAALAPPERLEQAKCAGIQGLGASWGHAPGGGGGSSIQGLAGAEVRSRGQSSIRPSTGAEAAFLGRISLCWLRLGRPLFTSCCCILRDRSFGAGVYSRTPKVCASTWHPGKYY